MDWAKENRLLNTLKSIDATLKRIEQNMSDKALEERMLNAMMDEKEKCGKSPLSSI